MKNLPNDIGYHIFERSIVECKNQTSSQPPQSYSIGRKKSKFISYPFSTPSAVCFREKLLFPICHSMQWLNSTGRILCRTIYLRGQSISLYYTLCIYSRVNLLTEIAKEHCKKLKTINDRIPCQYLV